MIPYEELCAALERFNRQTPAELHSSPVDALVDASVDPAEESLSTEAVAEHSDEPPNELEISDVLSDDFA